MRLFVLTLCLVGCVPAIQAPPKAIEIPSLPEVSHGDVAVEPKQEPVASHDDGVFTSELQADVDMYVKHFKWKLQVEEGILQRAMENYSEDDIKDIDASAYRLLQYRKNLNDAFGKLLDHGLCVSHDGKREYCGY